MLQRFNATNWVSELNEFNDDTWTFNSDSAGDYVNYSGFIDDFLGFHKVSVMLEQFKDTKWHKASSLFIKNKKVQIMISLKVRGHSWGHCEDGHILSAFIMWPLLLCLHVHHLLFMKHFSVTALVLGILKPLFLHAVMNAVTEVDHQTCSEKSVGRYHGYRTKLCREVCCLLKAYRRPSTQHNGPTCLIQAEPWGRRWWWCWEWEATAPKAPVTTHTYRHIYGNISGEGLGLEVFI